MAEAENQVAVIEKIPSGIPGFDEVTDGGLPRGRPTLVCGDAGAGKTMFGMQFLINGVSPEQEPGIFVAFEESENDLKENMASLGWDLYWLCQQKKMSVEAIKISSEEMTEAGQYELEVIDIYQSPEQAREHQIMAVSTLLKELPSPLRKIVGDLSEKEKVLDGLDIQRR